MREQWAQEGLRERRWYQEDYGRNRLRRTKLRENLTLLSLITKWKRQLSETQLFINNVVCLQVDGGTTRW